MRDLTKKQFQAACARRGFKPVGFMGYYNLFGSVGYSVSVSIYNAGHTRREQLAYLIREYERINREYEEKAKQNV